MFRPRTLEFLVAILAGYILLVIPGLVRPAYFDTPAGYLVIVPFFSVHVFHKLGVPGLLEHDGFCGWGWCSPTAFGWSFITVFWLLVAWGVAWGATVLTGRFEARDR